MVPGPLDEREVGGRYEPGVNRTYEEMAQHYGVAVVPARVAGVALHYFKSREALVREEERRSINE